MKGLLPLLVSLFLTISAGAQEAGPAPESDARAPHADDLRTPSDWIVRTDRSMPDVVVGADQEAADIWFVTMEPGWHITTGPAAIFYRPSDAATGEYTAEATIHLFDPQGRHEAFGLFFGGGELDADAWTYDYFVIRNSGEYLIKRRQGSDTPTLVEWTPHDAIRTFGPETESSVPNTLTVDVGSDEVVFSINGEEATRLPRAELRSDGIVGLRINHALNVHVEDLTVSK